MSSQLVHPRRSKPPRPRAQGVAMVWGIFAVIVCICFAVMAVDVGRYTLARGEAQTAADVAARYAAAGMIRSSGRSAFL